MRLLLAFLCIWISQTALANLNIENLAFNWNGAYMGVNIGAGLGRAHFSDPFGPSIFGNTVHTPIFLGGGQVGYNWKPYGTHWLFGVEGTASDFVSNGTFTGMAFSGFYLSQNCRVQPKLIATITGRVGTLVGPRCENLVYLKGGPAWIHNKVYLASNGLLPMPSVTTMNTNYSKWGLNVGGGIESALTRAWTLGLEYDYLQFNNVSLLVPASLLLGDIFTAEPSINVIQGAKSNMTQHIHLFKLSLNYKFGTHPYRHWNLFPFLSCTHNAHRKHCWDFEFGTRYWVGKERFQKDLGIGEDFSQADSLVSRLTYVSRSHANEIFGRIESPYNVFLKGFANIGSSHLHGKMNDEDWIAEDLMYSNTRHDVKGKLSYFTVDIGYDLFKNYNHKFGLFVGYNYYQENNTALGCTQIANPFGRCADSIPNGVPAITQDIEWQSCRLGLNSELQLYPGFKLTGDIAYLPYARFRGHDVHLLRNNVPNQNSFEFGIGQGVQAEASISYLITRNLSLGVGGRYFAMWTKQDAFTHLFGVNARRTLPSKTECFGGFLQLSYSFRALSKK